MQVDETANLYIEEKDTNGKVVKKRSALICNFYKSIPNIGQKGKVMSSDGKLLNKDWQPLSFTSIGEFRIMLPGMKNSGYDTCELAELGGMPEDIYEEIHNAVYPKESTISKNEEPAIIELVRKNEELAKQNEELLAKFAEMSAKIDDMSKDEAKERKAIEKQLKAKDIPFSEGDSLDILKEKLNK